MFLGRTHQHQKFKKEWTGRATLKPIQMVDLFEIVESWIAVRIKAIKVKILTTFET